jgi:aryl-alcohol dehydrogenase-like predicted oxidoreductase
VPIEDSVGALADLRREGKVRHIGLSNVSVAQLAAARKIVPIVSVQNSYSLANRASDDVLAACAAAGIAFLPYFPLGAGKIGSHAALAEIARRKGATPMQVALAWLLQRAPNVLPIPGTSSVTHLEENMKAAAIALTADEVARL